MTLEDRLEQLANRTQPGDPAQVLADARARSQSPDARRPGLLAAAAAVVAVLALAAGGLAILVSDDDEAATIAGPDPAPSVEGEWELAATIRGGVRQPARGDAAIAINGDTVTGTDGCSNALETRLDGDTVARPALRTAAGCIDDEANDEATYFWDVLEREPVYELRDGELWLVADESSGLVFSGVDESREEPTVAESVVSVAADGLGRLAPSVSPLAISERGWLEHAVTLENTGPDPVHLQDLRRATMLGDQEVAVATDGCGYATSGDQAVAMSCHYDYRPVTIEPGGTHTFTVTLWRGLTGMNPVSDGPHEWQLNLDQRTTPFDHPDQTGTTGTLTLTYKDLALQDEGSVADPEPQSNDDLSDADAEKILSDFLRLADEPSPDAVDRLPFAAEVQLGLGSELHQTRSRTQLADPASWVIDVEVFRALEGPFSALDVAAGAESTVVSVGEHPHCASPPKPPPDEVAHLTRASVQPNPDEFDTCLRWWTVDLFINETGRIEAVTLDLWEP